MRMETLNALKSATDEWILFDDQKRFAQNTHRKPLNWDALLHAIQDKQNLYAGVRLHHKLKILCVDIDARETPLTEEQAKEYINLFEELLGATCIPELSKNNGLHLFFKYSGTLPLAGRAKGIRKNLLDIPHTVEWYWHNQAILITNKNLAPWREWSSITPTDAKTILKIFPAQTETKTHAKTNTGANRKRKTNLKQKKTYTRRKNAWFELLPLLPELHTPLYAERIVREDNEKIFLRRPWEKQRT
ncbi:MAG: hypothetical protein KatS3mg087_1544 [Patescibacteria group bacterium]|nr:MAG: hypothetical protein KatS3mg087_1544 [Patescibacteria group bacterium]